MSDCNISTPFPSSGERVVEKGLILASNSPRRKELLAGLGVPFEVLVIPGIDESYPADLPAKDVAEYIARKKASAYSKALFVDTKERNADIKNSLLESSRTIVTADTVVVCGNDIMGKPKDEDDAYRMLRELSGKTHQVYTGVCITSTPTPTSGGRGGEGGCSFTVCTDVTFKELSDEEIWHYIRDYKPFDKAGAYGIQEWIGYIGITNINGSYYNVMGLPVQRIYKELKAMNII